MRISGDCEDRERQFSPLVACYVNDAERRLAVRIIKSSFGIVVQNFKSNTDVFHRRCCHWPFGRCVRSKLFWRWKCTFGTERTSLTRKSKGTQHCMICGIEIVIKSWQLKNILHTNYVFSARARAHGTFT